MRLTSYSDYSLRVLIYLALKKENELSTIQEIAEAYSISKNHLMKIIHDLGKNEYIETIRGRNGGIRLNKEPKEINIGELIRKTEEDFFVVECFEKKENNCLITPACSLKGVLYEAVEAFLTVLDKYTLEDLLENKNELHLLLQLKKETPTKDGA